MNCLDGTMFYLKEFTFNDIHFPRVYHFKKKYKWKKMNFVTHLPKNDPQVLFNMGNYIFVR